jgi:heme exporter protein D
VQSFLQWKETLSISYSGYVFVAFGFLHVMVMRSIVICVTTGSTILQHIISKIVLFTEKETFLAIKYVPATVFLNIYHSMRAQRGLNKNVYWSSCNVPVILILSYFNET